MRAPLMKLILACSIVSISLAYVCPEGKSGPCTKTNPNCASSYLHCSYCHNTCQTCFSTRYNACFSCKYSDHTLLSDDSCGVPPLPPPPPPSPLMSDAILFALSGVGVVLVVIIITIYVKKRPKSEEIPQSDQTLNSFAPSPAYAPQTQQPQLQAGFQPVNQPIF